VRGGGWAISEDNLAVIRQKVSRLESEERVFRIPVVTYPMGQVGQFRSRPGGA
jgi:hypothetical protein